QRLADDVEATRERRIPKGACSFTRRGSPNRGGERLFGVDEFGLGLFQGCGQGGNRFTRSLHRSPPFPTRACTHKRGHTGSQISQMVGLAQLSKSTGRS